MDQIDHVRLLLAFTVLGCVAVGLVPLPLSFAVWLVLPLLLLGWLQGQWRYWLTEDFVALFRWESNVTEAAAAKAKFWLTLPVIAVWGLVIGFRLGIVYGGVGWIGVAVVPSCGWIWLRTVNHLVTEVDRFRRHIHRRGRSPSA